MKKVLILLALLGVLAASWFWGLPAYRAQKERKFAAQARTQFVAGEHRKALISARLALASNPNNVTACEVMADLSDLSRSPAALTWRKRLAELNPSVSNQIMLASCALRYEQPPFPIAAQTIEALATNAATFPQFHVVAAQLALKQQRIPEAEKHFEEAIRIEPTNELHRLNLATVRLQSRDAAVSSAAHAELVRLQTNATLGNHALRALATARAAYKDWPEALKFSAALQQDSGATFDDRLQHLILLHTAKSPDFSRFAGELKQRASTNAGQIFALSTRLAACGQAAETLAWLKSLPAAMQSEHSVSLAFADTFGALKDWRAMEERLNAEGWKEQDFMRLALLALAVRNQNDQAVSQAHWGKAVQLALERPERLGMLSQLARGWKWDAEVNDLLWRVTKQFPQEKWPIQALHADYARKRDTRGLHAIYSLLVDRGETNALVLNNYASLSLLLATNMPRAHEFAQQVYLAATN
ncbi:MAG TPA: hypothetical protein VK530_14210, partial [Candidatus Acidoferrum sp.]|nr:hypothetical protein [Candidatus Acidoferrum sp.]